MRKTIALIGLVAALALPPVAASAQTGTFSSWGSYGSGQQIPTQALTPFDRAEYRAIAGSEWIRDHAGTGQHSGRIQTASVTGCLMCAGT